MNKKLLLILFIILCKISFAQNITKIYAGNGISAATRPNVLLKLKDDNTYDLQIFNDNYFTWQFYNGDYSVKEDTLWLQYKQLNVVPTCRLIDTFYHKRTVHFLYVDAADNLTDTLSVEFSRDTIDIDHFPLSYRNKENNNNIKGNIKYTWYVPDFSGGEIYIKFYKPARQMKDKLLIPLKINNSYLLVDDEYKYLFVPFDKLKLE